MRRLARDVDNVSQNFWPRLSCTRTGGGFLFHRGQFHQGFPTFGDEQRFVGTGDFIDQFQAFGFEFRRGDTPGASFVTCLVVILGRPGSRG
jgi:hypothetical protein